MLIKVRTGKGVAMVFDSSKIPGEIIDMMVVRTDAPDALKKALTGAWFETMAAMSGSGKPAKDAIAFMAAKAGGTVAEFEAQLKATVDVLQGRRGRAFAKSPKLKETMEFVRTFSFEKGLFGQGARTKDAVGISFPGRQHARQSEEREAALRRHLHAAGGGRHSCKADGELPAMRLSGRQCRTPRSSPADAVGAGCSLRRSCDA